MGKLSGKFIFTKCFVPEAGTFFNSLFKKRLWHKWFPVNSVEFLRTPCLQNTSGRLLLFFKIYVRTSFCAVQFRQSPDGFNLQIHEFQHRKTKKMFLPGYFQWSAGTTKMFLPNYFQRRARKRKLSSILYITQSISYNTAFLWR